MKTKLTKAVLICGMTFPLMFGVLGCNKNEPAPVDQDTDEPAEETKSYNVTLNQGEGYNLIGASTVNEGANYVFSLTINDGYDDSEMVVKCNNQVINDFTINNVHENLNITVEGVYKQSKIILAKALYRLEKNSVTDTDRNPETYLVGVSGLYRGENCQVAVSLSEVNFDAVGTYVVTYNLVGHENIKNYASIEIYELPTIDDVTLDLSNTYVPFVSYDAAGQVHIDFEIKDATGHVLTNDEVKYSTNDNINYLTTSYCRNLVAGNSYQYKVVIEEDEIPFALTVTDNEEAKVLFTADSGVYTWTPANPQALPTASLRITSAQNVSFEYLLNGEAVNPETLTLAEAGDYQYVIKVIHNDAEVVALQHNYEIHVLNNYDITEDVDINGAFFFYNTDIFERYFVGSLSNHTSVRNTDANSKYALLTGPSFAITTELIAAAKAKGFNQMKLTIEAEALDGSAINSIPYVTQGTDDWQLYWDQNSCDGTCSVILDLDRIDLETYPSWFMKFSFRTVESGANDANCDFAISDVLFSVKKIVSPDWLLKNSSGIITETTDIDEHTFQAKVENLSYDWHHIYYNKAHEMYEAGYTICTVQVSGNNHNVFAYSNNEAEISNYDHKISVGGGTTKLTLSDSDTLVGVMTSHENNNVPGNQDEEGVYGKTEDLTITLTFSEPRVPTLLDKMYTEDAWTSTGSLTYDFNDGVDSTISTDDTWSLYFSTSYATELYEAGYRTMTATFTITGDTSDYLTTIVSGLVTSYKNDESVYTLSFLLENLKTNRLQVRTNDQDVTDGDHNTGCTGNGITISNIIVSNEEDASILQAQARRRLSRMFYAESNCWNYFHHNKWGENSWGPDCTKAVFGTADAGQPYFTIQNNFFQDMKLAGYTSFSFHVKAEWTDGGDALGNIAVTTSGGHLAYNAVYKEYDNVYEADFSFDVTTFLSDMNTSDYLTVAARGVQPGCESRTSILTLSNVSFSE